MIFCRRCLNDWMRKHETCIDRDCGGKIVKVSVLAILALLATILGIVGYCFAGASQNTYHAEVLRVIDGDTVEVKIELWPQHFVVTRMRERGVDAPELKGKCDREKVLAKKAAEFTRSKLGEEIIVQNVKPDKFGERFDGEIHTKSGRLASLLIEAKLARPYDGKGKRLGWCGK